MKRPTAVILCSTLLAACDRPEPESSATDAPAMVEYGATMQIGGDLNDEKAEFGRISGLAVDARGRVFIADAQANEIRAFSPDAKYLYTIGRNGAGPGEMAGPCCIAFDAKGQLWVRDGGNSRYSVFTVGDTSGTYVTQQRMLHGDVNRWATTTFESSGHLIDIGMSSDPNATRATHRMTLGPDNNIARDIAVPEVPAESTAMKSVTKPTQGGSVTMYAYQPYGPLQLVAHGPNGEWAHGVSARYAIDWRGVEGSLIRHVTGDVQEGPALSDREKKLADQRMVDQTKRIGADLGFAVPANKPVLRDLFFDADGRLWVELNVPDGDARRAHIYDRTGKRVIEVRWPAHANASDGFIRGDTIWAIGTDTLGIQSVVRLHAMRK